MPRQQVTAHFTSGLGNRLFQAAAAAWYASKHDRQFVICEALLEVPVHASEANEVLLDLLHTVPVLKQRPSDVAIVSEQDLAWPQTASFIVLEGYFQQETFAEALRPYVTGYLRRLLHSTPRSPHCFVHVRQGDYKGRLFNIFALRDLPEYYRRALRMLPGPYLLTSDEPQRAQTMLEALWPEASERSLLETTHLGPTLASLIMCSRAIVCNSTFSWWAARLMTWSQCMEHQDPRASGGSVAAEGPTSGPIVVVPKTWCRTLVDLSWFAWIPGFRWAPIGDLGTPESAGWTSVDWPTNDGLEAAELALIALVAGLVLRFARSYMNSNKYGCQGLE